MKFVNEYRQSESIQKIAAEIRKVTTQPWTIMEVCGGQTHAIVKNRLDQLLPQEIELVHGPGCPVCVTPLETVDRAITIAALPEVIFCSFGDMLRVPGSECSLLDVKADGGDIRIVYSPLQAVKIAEDNPAKQIVFFAVGFETTATANAMAATQAKNKSLQNFSLLVSQFLVTPAIASICSAGDSRVQGFLAAGHVCSITGYENYLPLAEKYRVPIVVTGFEPLDILEGLLMCLRQLEQGSYRVENQYLRAVERVGNRQAQTLLDSVFKVSAQQWRGLGEIPASGLGLRKDFLEFDAVPKFKLPEIKTQEQHHCISGAIMLGHKKPADCPHFGTDCRPDRPLGAPMVSSEGACSAYHRYSQQVKAREYSVSTPSDK
ncbi:hydrogenase formation protein HypD [Microbulbifer sp. THAF38]|uniref:hydrogenase formation protein HypD n=1 Tax=Microbulbifer sp. THAF38 TaxID=2587856 RepID=UPI0012682D34|nr:hydrogenase formation protein HypD [Microbulbifer sp. THAF38]QFT54870.1 Hydrogenase isoenzymes formation protein HypD [Microbulbifer sp. THAF38]